MTKRTSTKMKCGTPKNEAVWKMGFPTKTSPKAEFVHFWSNLSDRKHDLGPQKVAFRKGNPLTSGKSRLLKYDSIWRDPSITSHSLRFLRISSVWIWCHQISQIWHGSIFWSLPSRQAAEWGWNCVGVISSLVNVWLAVGDLSNIDTWRLKLFWLIEGHDFGCRLFATPS